MDHDDGKVYRDHGDNKGYDMMTKFQSGGFQERKSENNMKIILKD